MHGHDDEAPPTTKRPIRELSYEERIQALEDLVESQRVCILDLQHLYGSTKRDIEALSTKHARAIEQLQNNEARRAIGTTAAPVEVTTDEHGGRHVLIGPSIVKAKAAMAITAGEMVKLNAQGLVEKTGTATHFTLSDANGKVLAKGPIE